MTGQVKSEMKCALTLTAAVLVSIMANPNFFGLDSVYSMSSQDNDDIGDASGRMNATTECVGFGTDSQSGAELEANGASITQQCDQVISSADRNGSNNMNYARNTVQDNDIAGDNQVSQQSKQKIGG
jgi:hypothetical protein